MTDPLHTTKQKESVMPEMYVYLPKATTVPTKAAIIYGVGGFNQGKLDHEGHQFAQWLNTIGVASIALSYHLPSKDKMVIKIDFRQAVETVREKAKE